MANAFRLPGFWATLTKFRPIENEFRLVGHLNSGLNFLYQMFLYTKNRLFERHLHSDWHIRSSLMIRTCVNK